ncbi:uncharacterized protein LOC117327832 [Pecten maximus]|uniref:uncharacterized protein LOC117327832 n=1 Tax=Pecten maximus TaxID=6579 RepID=UPI0014584F5C|nr:uncharacterized protein LOC117327832 [Pecten maximus]XP_033740927.1 uncharacterized protein LOC117327832 [Pecten maximus]
MSTAKAEFQTFKQQKAVKDDSLRQERVKGAKCLHYVGILMLIASLGLLITSSVFMDLVNKSENMHLGSIPIGLFAAVLGMAGGLCEYCASRNIVESEAKGCSKSLVIGNFVLSFVALGQCVIASGFAGSTYSTCTEDPGPAPDKDSWFTIDFRQCVSYRSEIKTSAIFLILFGIALAVMSVTSIVVYCMYKTSFGVFNQQQMLLQVERDVGAIQHIFNLQSQYPDRNACGIEDLQQMQSYITEIQTKLTEAAAVPQRRGVGAPIILMNLQSQVTILQQTLNTLIQMSSQPQQPVQPFQPQPMGHGYPGYPGYPMGGQGQPISYPHGQGQPVPYSQGQGQPVPYSQGQGQPVPYSQGQAMYYNQGDQVQAPLMNYPQEGQGHHPQNNQAGSQLPPSYETVMAKEHDVETEKNWV